MISLDIIYLYYKLQVFDYRRKMFAVRNLILPFVKVNNLKICSAFYSSSAVFKEQKIKVDKWDINYLKVGNGPHTVLCMPGALGSIWTDFKPQVEGINREKFTVVAWDPPGYGKSRPPERDFPTDFYEKDADYAFKFMKALNIPKYSLLGWSDGGISSMIFAAKYPDAINKLVLFGANAMILPHELDIYKKIRDINSWSKRMREPMVAVYGEEVFKKLWSDWVDGMINLYSAKNGDICSAVLKDIKCPTLILYGQKDPMVDSSHVSQMHTHIQGSRIHLYPDGKHNIHIKYAEDFNKRVEEFLIQGTTSI